MNIPTTMTFSDKSHLNTTSQQTRTVYYQNVRGLKSKTNVIFNTISTCKYDIIAFAETWLDSSISDPEIFNTQYNVCRSDRNFEKTGLARGGGVLLAINRNFSVKSLDFNAKFDNLPLIDIVGAKIIVDFCAFFVIVCYIPPNISTDCYNLFFDIISSLDYLYDSDVLILGDFNIPEYSDYLLNSRITDKTLLLLNFLELLNLRQFNNINNVNQKFLDLVLSNKDCTVDKAIDVLIQEDAYHPAIIISYNIQKNSRRNKQSTNQTFYNFRRADFYSLYGNLLEVNWDFLNTVSDVDTACNQFYTKIYEIFDRWVPKTRIHRRKYPPWFNSDIIKCIQLKFKVWKEYKRFKDPLVLEEFKFLRNKIKVDINHSYKVYCANIENNLKFNPGKFWKFINDKRNSNGLPGNMTYRENNINNNSKDIANAFADCFQNSYILSDYSDRINEPVNSANADNIQLKKFSTEEVLKSIKKIKPKSTAGPDKIPAFILYDCAHVFCTPLTIIFNLSISTNKYPDIWKVSKITPVYKKGDRNKIENYRPITIIDNFSKCLEILVHEFLFNQVKNKIVPQQHGFMKGGSTVTNLLCITQYIADALDASSQVDVIYTDFSKAFDRLDHIILLNKLKAFGLSLNLIDFLKSYLQNRRQFVQCSGQQSKEICVTSGVPQGSILGPLFFNIFINNIIDGLNVKCLLYADDMKIYGHIRDTHDCVKLQLALDQLSLWCVNNRLALNVSKCNVMSFSLKHCAVEYDYTLDGQVLQRPNIFCDLGVTFDRTLSFTAHISNVITSCFRSLGFIIRNSHDFVNTGTIKLLYFAYVRSRAEYASVIWSPYYNVHINNLERIQRRFLKYLSFKEDGTYPEPGISHNQLLVRHSTASLEERRIISQLVFLYKLINGQIVCEEFLSQICFSVPRLFSRQSYTFYLPTPRINVKKFSPLYQMCSNYNLSQDMFDIFNCNVTAIKKPQS